MTNLLRNKLTLIINSESQNHGAGIRASAAAHENVAAYDPIDCSAPESIPESILIGALEQATESSWRLVCASLAAEQCEPYRTCFLSKEVRNLLRLWSEWQSCDYCHSELIPDPLEESGAHNFCPQSLMIDVDLYRPLERVAPVSLSQMSLSD